MKRLSVTIIVIMILVTTPIIANASAKVNVNAPPVADIYKEGIYHFSESVGKNLP